MEQNLSSTSRCNFLVQYLRDTFLTVDDYFGLLKGLRNGLWSLKDLRELFKLQE